MTRVAQKSPTGAINRLDILAYSMKCQITLIGHSTQHIVIDTASNVNMKL